MSEQSEQDKHIKCKVCKCKYMNDEEHIKQDFVYNRLGGQLESCVNRRDRTNKDKEKKKQQIIDTNVDTLCTRCCQVKPQTGFGEYEMYVYDKELKRTQKVMMPYKSCARCREQQNKYQGDNADKQRAYSTLHKQEQEVNKDTEQVCARCLETEPTSEYGEYKTWAFTQDTSPVQEVFLPYKSCKGCRDKDKLYNEERRGRGDTSTRDTSDDNGCIEYESGCYYDGCVGYSSDGDMVGFR